MHRCTFYTHFGPPWVERGLNTIPIGELSGTHIFRATIRQIFPCTAVDQGGKI